MLAHRCGGQLRGVSRVPSKYFANRIKLELLQEDLLEVFDDCLVVRLRLRSADLEECVNDSQGKKGVSR